MLVLWLGWIENDCSDFGTEITITDKFNSDITKHNRNLIRACLYVEYIKNSNTKTHETEIPHKNKGLSFFFFFLP